jgi:hypothetical protein
MWCRCLRNPYSSSAPSSLPFSFPPSFPLHKSKSELIKFDQKTTSSNRKSNLGKEGSKQAAQSTKFTIYLQNHRASSEIRKRNG